MNTQPEALLCAEMLEVARDNPTWADYSEIPKGACRRSAAELRRLSAENDLLGSAADKLRTLHSDERMELLRQRDQATAQRDQLLGAAKDAVPLLEHMQDNAANGYLVFTFPTLWELKDAIKAAEENK